MITSMEPVVLGALILKIKIVPDMIDSINEICDEAKKQDEYDITHLLTDTHNVLFSSLFNEYMKQIDKHFWECHLDAAWYNDMRTGEYNPFHIHKTKTSELGLSSVLMLKRPDTYGEEHCNEHGAWKDTRISNFTQSTRNGCLTLFSGFHDPLYKSMYQVDAEVGDFFIFPFTMLHGVYPFNGTDDIRRTLSYNCNLVRNSEKMEK